MVFTSEADFENNVIAVLQQHGWTDGVLRYPKEADLLENWKQILFKNNIGKDQLANCPLTDGEMDQIVEQIESLRTPLALNSFINGKTVAITRDNPDDKLHFGKEVSLKIYDRREIAGGNSVYQIAQQPIYPARKKILNSRRGDLCLLINGMPVIHIELKKSGVPVSQACGQIAKYSHEGVFTGIFRLVQLFVGMNPDDAVYFANPGPDNFNPNFYFHWADFNNEPMCANKSAGQDEWKRFCSELLSIPMAHQLIGFYTVADSDDGCLKVLRSYQYYAASKISDRVRKCHWDEPIPVPGRPGGYVWHTTGSGKTMTSFKSAQLIADSHDADKVIFLMDRIELGTQSLRAYQSLADNQDDVQGTENTSVLKSKIGSTNPSNTLIVTSIQKMSNIKVGFGGVTQGELDRLGNRRIVFIIDECHRTTFGDMLHDIRQSFPNALFFGFTGTPILEENQKGNSDTKMIFGDCLHRYSIADGIRDHNVLGFDTYEVQTFKDSDVRRVVALDCAKAQTVEEAMADPAKKKAYLHFMDKSQVPMNKWDNGFDGTVLGIEDYLKRVQYAPETDHPAAVVDDIIDQFPVLSCANMLHAIFATSSIPEAINYYRLFKEKAPSLHVVGLFDPSVDNAAGATVKQDALVELIEDYNARYGKEFTLPTWPAMKRDISSRLAHKAPYGNVDKDRSQRIDILIVVDQMLTGFDSRWVNTLYLDKVLKYEAVIQAFSRTNRLFSGNEKPFGTIRYYRKPHTMTNNIRKAVKLYSGDRPLDLFAQKLPSNIRSMNMRFEEIEDIFKSAGIDGFVRNPDSEEARQKFVKDFLQLSRFLSAALVQGFSWEQDEYRFEEKDGSVLAVGPVFGEQTYLILVQRYKELVGGGSGGGDDFDPPYDLDTHITEIDTGLIDTNYMNANFTKWLKALHGDSKVLEAATEELHRSFAVLSQDDQRLAELFLHDVASGEATVEDAVSLRDYITRYAHREKNEQVDKLVNGLGVDRDQLVSFMSRDVNDSNINEFGKFDALKNSVDIDRAKEFFEAREGAPLSVFKVNVRVANLLKKFILSGGFDIDSGEVSA